MSGIINCPRPSDANITPIARFLDELKHDRTAINVAGLRRPEILIIQLSINVC